jgi:hypothetical protein
MGYNIRYISKEKIKNILKEEGIESLIDMVKKPNTLITEDEFSEKICDIIKGDDKKLLIELLTEDGIYGS